ncbi:DUF4136 domain-containing protein [Paraburkholderia phosphatilytica]|uniref:DUF4136 domain-containing protein n=1 Tax=Paraburkholderia phosphatilytica TaxID=2282883 RepID=UPI000E520841|nr:DUF4136 domain-containing protein [Paraburkholderia phosphatilytica]
MKIGPVQYAVLAVALLCLGGCAGIEADVHASGVAGVATTTVAAGTAVKLPGAQTYRVARMPSQEGAVDHPQYEALLRDQLAGYGLVDDESDTAHYVLSIAYATRPTTVNVHTGDCSAPESASAADTGCGAQASPGAAWFGRQTYRHALSLRFFDRATGAEVYKVSAMLDDRDADPAHALPGLVKSALAKFPFESAGQWRVKLRVDDDTHTPAVVSVMPVTPAMQR